MAENFANEYQTTLSGAINNAVTSLVVASATGSPAANFRIRIDDELMLVTAKSGTTFTVTRGVEGTTAASHSDGATVTHVLTALGLTTAISEGATGGGDFVGCSIYHNTTQNPANPGVLAFNSEVYDTDGFHDTSTNNSRVTIPSGMGGKYLFTFGSVSSSSTDPATRIKKNGSTYIGPNWYPDNGFAIHGAVVVDLAAADYVEVERSGSGTLGHASAFEAQTQLTCTQIDGGGGGGSGSVFGGARVKNSAAHTISHNTLTKITFNQEDFDTDGYHSTSSDTNRITIPSGVDYVELTVTGYWSNSTGGLERDVLIQKNGASGAANAIAVQTKSNQNVNLGVEVSTGPLAVVAGDYFEVEVYQDSSANLNFNNARFSVKKIAGGAGVGAPTSAKYVVQAADGGLSAEQVFPELLASTAGSDIDMSGAATGSGISVSTADGLTLLTITNAGFTHWDVADAIGTGDFDRRVRIVGWHASDIGAAAAPQAQFVLWDTSRTTSTHINMNFYGRGNVTTAGMPQVDAAVGSSSFGFPLRHVVPPYILRLTRVGTTVTAYTSLDNGRTWVRHGSTTSSLNIARMGLRPAANGVTEAVMLVHWLRSV